MVRTERVGTPEHGGPTPLGHPGQREQRARARAPGRMPIGEHRGRKSPGCSAQDSGQQVGAAHGGRRPRSSVCFSWSQFAGRSKPGLSALARSSKLARTGSPSPEARSRGHPESARRGYFWGWPGPWLTCAVSGPGASWGNAQEPRSHSPRPSSAGKLVWGGVWAGRRRGGGPEPGGSDVPPFNLWTDHRSAPR